jgi:hypothetical protein
VLTDTEAGMEYFGRSLAKGTVVLRGNVKTRKGTSVPASHVRAGWWIQNVEWSPNPAEPAPPLYITGHSIDLAENKNALTIGVDWMEREIGVRMGELLAMPASVTAVAAGHEYVGDVATPFDPSEPWAPEPFAEPWKPGLYEVPDPDPEPGRLEDYPKLKPKPEPPAPDMPDYPTPEPEPPPEPPAPVDPSTCTHSRKRAHVRHGWLGPLWFCPDCGLTWHVEQEPPNDVPPGWEA